MDKKQTAMAAHARENKLSTVKNYKLWDKLSYIPNVKRCQWNKGGVASAKTASRIVNKDYATDLTDFIIENEVWTYYNVDHTS